MDSAPPPADDSLFTGAAVRARWADSGLDKRLGPLILLSGRLLTRRIEQALAAAGLGLTPAQARSLVMLRIHGSISQQALAVCMDVEPSTVVKTLDVLEREDLARREPDPDDRRAHRVSLTERGDELVPRLFALWDQVEKELFDVMDATEQEALRDYLRRVIGRMWSGGLGECGEE